MFMGMGMGCYRRLIYKAFRKTGRSVPRNSFSSRSAAHQNKSPAVLVTKRHWYQNPKTLISLGFVGCWVVIPVYYWNSETVPYANRGHFVLPSTSLERKMLESSAEKLIKSDKFKGKIVESDRVDKIWKDIIGVLMRNQKIQTPELFNLEIIVVDEPIVYAASSPGGKILIYTGLLNFFKTDAEIANVIAHEVGHLVARHFAERASVVLWVTILIGFMFKLSMNSKKTLDRLLLRLPPRMLTAMGFTYFVSSVYLFWSCSAWQEMEADYIGMLISASAGYDPRIAPLVYLKLGMLTPSRLALVLQVLNPHPQGTKRARRLLRPEIMEEAIAMYTEALNHKDNNT